MLGQLGCDVEYWPAERVRAFLRSERYFQAIHFPRAFSIHPLNYALVLAAAAERDGARIFENTPALSIDPAGVRKRIVTPHARLRADQVVLCGNVELRGLMPRLAATLIPITTYVITTQPLGSRLGEAVAYRGAVSDTDRADNHYRIVGGDRLMWSGRATTWARNPRSIMLVRSPPTSRRLTRSSVRSRSIMPGRARWATRAPHAADRRAWARACGSPAGFGGHGLNTTAIAGNLIARADRRWRPHWRQFTPFELVWAGGVLGRAAAQVRSFTKRLRAAVVARRAQAREKARAQARERARAPHLETSAKQSGRDAANAAQSDAGSRSIAPQAADAQASGQAQLEPVADGENRHHDA